MEAQLGQLNRMMESDLAQFGFRQESEDSPAPVAKRCPTMACNDDLAPS